MAKKKKYGLLMENDLYGWYETPGEAYKEGVSSSYGKDFVIVKRIKVETKFVEETN